MPTRETKVVVAGHICLDIIPTCDSREGGLESLLVPGSVVEIGPAVLSTGGAVSNTGLALHRLGVGTRLIGKVGDDLFGDAILSILKSYDPALATGMLITPGVPSSYSLVISPPGVDRAFLHCPGANNTFSADDVPQEELASASLFHFGYPPVMRRTYENNGAELETMFRRVKQRGVATSLDMCVVDPASEAGRVDWRALLARVLPHVDVFVPSLDEILFMLDRAHFERLDVQRGPVSQCDGTLLADVAGELLAMNAGVVGLKLGDRGLYVRTTTASERLSALRFAAGDPLDTWLGRELLTPCFEVEVVGTTGCGDCTIAGFLTGLLRGLPLEQTMTAAVAVGACNVEQPDATSGVPTWDAVQARIRAGWNRRLTTLDWPGWNWDATGSLAVGPNDTRRV